MLTKLDSETNTQRVIYRTKIKSKSITQITSFGKPKRASLRLPDRLKSLLALIKGI